jgi:hypothetical protein
MPLAAARDGSYHSWNSDAEARQRLREEADDFSRKLKEARTPERWDEVLSGKKTIPVIGGVFQSACSIQLLGQPTVTDYCMMTLTNVGTGKRRFLIFSTRSITRCMIVLPPREV